MILSCCEQENLVGDVSGDTSLIIGQSEMETGCVLLMCADVEGSRNSADVRENRCSAIVEETCYFFRRAGNQISGSWYEMLLIWL